MSESRGEGDMQGVDRLGDASAPQILEYGVQRCKRYVCTFYKGHSKGDTERCWREEDMDMLDPLCEQ